MSDTQPLAEGEYLFTSESVTEGHPDKVCDADLRRRARRGDGGRPGGPRRLRDPGQHRHGGGLRRDLDRRPPRRARAGPRDDPRDRLRPRRLRLPLRPHLGPGLARQAVARHRPGRRQGLRDAHRVGRGRAADRRRRRPGNDVRLRDRRDRGADADADPPRPPARRAARGGAQGRHASTTSAPTARPRSPSATPTAARSRSRSS